MYGIPYQHNIELILKNSQFHKFIIRKSSANVNHATNTETPATPKAYMEPLASSIPPVSKLGVMDTINLSLFHFPEGVAFDSTNGYVYVTNYYSNNISIINGATNTVIKNIGVGSSPAGATFDSTNGYVYVTNYYSNDISIINGATNTVIKNISVGSNPYGAAFDSTNGYVYVTNAGSNSVSVINGTTNTAIKNIGVGSSPLGAAFDSTNGYVYVSIGSGAVSVLGYVTSSTKYSITFTETGLPSGTIWYVNLSNGQTFSDSKNTISFSELNGTYSYTIATVNKSWSSSGGSLTVNGNPVSQPVAFSEVTYKVTFTETGLPSGTTWYVNITGQASSGPITGTSYSASLSNSSYSYTISAANKQYKASPSNGTFSVAGSSKSISTTFSSTNASSSSTLYDIIGAVIAIIIIASVSIILIKRKRV